MENFSFKITQTIQTEIVITFQSQIKTTITSPLVHVIALFSGHDREVRGILTFH